MLRFTRLPSGLTVVTETMPHLESVALGVWIKSGSRNETDRRARHRPSARAHGLQGHRAPQRPRDRRGDRECRRRAQRRHLAPKPPPITPACLKDHVPLAVDILADILTESGFDEEELGARSTSSCRRSARPTTRPTTSSSTSSPRSPIATRRSAAPILGTPETVQVLHAEQIRDYLRPQLRRPTACSSVAAGGGRSRRLRKRGGEALRRACRTTAVARRPCSRRQLYRRRRARDARPDGRAGPARLRGQGLSRARLLLLRRSWPTSSAAACPRALFQEVREHRGLCYSVYAFHWGFSDTGIFGIHAATGSDDLPKLMPVIVERAAASRRDTIHQEEIDRARAQIRAQLRHGPGEPGGPRRPDRPPDDAVSAGLSRTRS